MNNKLRTIMFKRQCHKWIIYVKYKKKYYVTVKSCDGESEIANVFSLILRDKDIHSM